MSQNGAGRGTLDAPASLMSGNGSKKASEAEFGMENSPNQPMAQGGVQAHLPKPPGTPIVDNNMRMVTAAPQGGGTCPRNSDKRYKWFASGRPLAKGDFPGEFNGGNAGFCWICKLRGIFANLFGSRSPF